MVAARFLAAAGVAAIPARADGSKAPALGTWKQYQQQMPTGEELARWFGAGHNGIGVVTGPVSGHLELAELEGRAADQLPELAALADATGLGDLWRTVNTGWVERSPSGGIHWFYRLPEQPPGNTKLASRRSTPEELAANPGQKIQVLAETRGTGGFVVVAPSNGTTHPTGRPWTVTAGGPDTIPTLSMDEHEQFHALLGTLHQEPPSTPDTPPASPFAPGQRDTPAARPEGELRPGDDYENKTDWADILEPEDWTLTLQRGGTRYWCRPGKRTGISATTGNNADRDRLWVFSTSTNLPAGEPITKFRAYSLLHHGGDNSKAAAELRRQDYGDPAPAPQSKSQPGPAASGDGGEVPLDDSPLAQWTADRLRGTCCWAGGLGWLTYKDGVWKEVTEATAVELVRQQFRALHHAEIDRGASYDRAKKLAALLTAGKIRAVAGLLKGILEADGAGFDAHPDLLNVRNGVVDLRTGQLLEHDPAYRFTKIAGTTYEPGARHVDWDKALTALPPEVAPWMQARFGQAATGHPVPDDIMPVLSGGGENGKSSVMAAIQAALGDHAVYVPERVLLANPSDHPTELTTLQGARLAFIEETPEARHLNVKRLKDTVGTPTMTARRIRQDTITWQATHSLFLTTNYRPRVDETDHGTWRRLALVNFPYTYLKPGAQPTEPNQRPGDQGLRDRIPRSQPALQAVLAWVVDGARAWYGADRIMPPMPAPVAEDTDAWRGESDLVWSYLQEHIEFDPEKAILSTDLLEGFNTWLRGQNHREWTAKTFVTRLESQPALKQHGAVKQRVNDPTNLSRLHAIASPALQGKQRVWQGMRFAR